MELDLQKYDTYLFDLDDTLIDEKAYLWSAYKAISRYFAAKYAKNQRKMYRFLQNNPRKRLFNAFLDEFGIPITELSTMLEILRGVEVKLKIYPQMLTIIRKLIDRGKDVAIVTNGNHQQQANKLRCANFGGLRDDIMVYFANKPAPLDAEFGDAVMIGDSKTDKLFAEAMDIDFVRVVKTK